MKHLFVPYEIALLAKEKGFDEPCLAYYERQELSSIVEYGNSKLRQVNLINGQCLAPLYQQLIDWFLNKKILIQSSCLDSWDNWVYYIWMEDIGAPFFKVNKEVEEFPTKYEALNKALEEAFELLNIEEVK